MTRLPSDRPRASRRVGIAGQAIEDRDARRNPLRPRSGRSRQSLRARTSAGPRTRRPTRPRARYRIRRGAGSAGAAARCVEAGRWKREAPGHRSPERFAQEPRADPTPARGFSLRPSLKPPGRRRRWKNACSAPSKRRDPQCRRAPGDRSGCSEAHRRKRAACSASIPPVPCIGLHPLYQRVEVPAPSHHLRHVRQGQISSEETMRGNAVRN